MTRCVWAAARSLVLCLAILPANVARSAEPFAEVFTATASASNLPDPFASGAAPALETSDLPAALSPEQPTVAAPDDAPLPVGTDVLQRMHTPFDPGPTNPVDYWSWDFLPSGLLYKSYLAGMKEPRLAAVWEYESGFGWYWDATIGARVGLFRYGTHGPRPEGWQLDIEGAAFPRLNFEENWDLESADFRVGVPLTWSYGPMQMKFAYYHISSHAGDEFLERNPGFQRINYVRDALVLGYGVFPVPDVRLYSEIAWAFHHDGGAEPLEFQFGAEYSPVVITPAGSPFVAANVHLFEEHDFGGSINVQTGWQWRSRNDRLFRIGLQYFNGKTSQFAFLDNSEELIGAGLWLDY